MLQYTLLLQVLFVVELCGWEMVPELNWLGREKYSEISEDKIETIPNARAIYFPLALNHFNGDPVQFWPQAAFIVGEHYRPGGPAFLIIGNSRIPTAPSWIEYAKRFGAICVYLPRRYYGHLKPVRDVRLVSLQYLTSEQTLEDAASVIDIINHTLPKGTKWIVFGGGYEGSLAAWMRLKYPHLVHGAVASSAPLNFDIKYPDFYRIMLENLAKRSSKCRDSMEGLFSELQNRTERQDIATFFGFCNSIKPFTYNDKSYLILMLLNWLADTDREFPTIIDKMCNFMTVQDNRTFFERFINFIRNGNVPIPVPDKYVLCKYNEYTELVRRIQWNPYSDERLELYESCTNLGLFKTQKSVGLGFFQQLCVDVFGPKYYELTVLASNIRNTHITYGGTKLVVTNVVFVQGTADPWFAAGVQKNISSEAPAVIIEGGSHCADMKQAMPTDSPQLKAARVKIASYIETWLKT